MGVQQVDGGRQVGKGWNEEVMSETGTASIPAESKNMLKIYANLEHSRQDPFNTDVKGKDGKGDRKKKRKGDRKEKGKGIRTPSARDGKCTAGASGDAHEECESYLT